MSGKLIAVANMKGGVGKTTTVVSLAESLAADDASVLVVDLDPQASASVCLAGDELLAQLIGDGRTLDAFLALRMINRDKSAKLATRIRPNVSKTVHGGAPLRISLLPCGPYLRLVEREIIYELTGRDYSMNGIDGQLLKLFDKEFLPLANEYDYVIFDCAPGISPLTEVTIRAANLVVVPSIPDFLSTYGLNAFYQSLWKSGGRTLGAPKRLPHVLVTRWQKGVKQHEETLERLEAEAASEDAGFRMFETRIPQAAGLAKALTMMDVVQTFQQKYGTLVPNILTPLVGELKGLLDAH